LKIKKILSVLENWAPPSLQESYDNCGLQTGLDSDDCTGVLVALDFTEAVLEEAVSQKCNLIVAHHPLIFKPLKSLAGNGFQARMLRYAIHHKLALYALHTSLDNVYTGVNRQFALRLGLLPETLKVLEPITQKLIKLQTYVPVDHLEKVQQALFAAGAGSIGNYVECSFRAAGTGTFRPLEHTNPYIGTAGGAREQVKEFKLEVILPEWQKQPVLNALLTAHPYEEVAYEWIPTLNSLQDAGSGMIGFLPEPVSADEFLHLLAARLSTPVVRHSPLPVSPIHKVALCGGAGAFLITKALNQGAQAFVTADLKYHDFFLPDGQLLLADIGHAESEIATIQLITDYIKGNFPTFAVLKSQVDTNPVRYFTGGNT
jgi:dinuclear metal center YbgI/SA1388 family protein